MRTALPAALALATGAAACGDPVTVTVVRIEARPAVREVELLEVTFSNGNATLSETFEVDGRDFPLSFSVETPDRSGEIAFEATGRDEDGVLVALGSASSRIVTDEVVETTLRLEPADFQVNTEFAGFQRLAWSAAEAGTQIAAGADGTFTIGFTDDCGELIRCDLWGRRFDARTTPLTTEIEASDSQFLVNRTEVFGDDPAMAVAPDGTVAAVWVAIDQVLAMTITPTGGAGSAVETVVSTGDSPDHVAVAALPDGRFFVVWAETDTVSSDRVIRGRLLNPDASLAVNPDTGDTTPITLDTTTNDTPDVPVVAATGRGLEVGVLWRVGTALRVRFTNQSGMMVPQAQEIEIASFNVAEDVWSPQLAAAANGRFVAAWGRRNFDGDAPEGVIEARLISPPLGVQSGADTILARGLPDLATRFGLASDGAGTLVATWFACDIFGDDRGCGIRARSFRASGLPAGDAAIVNTTTAGDQISPAVAWLGAGGGGGFAVAWTDDSREGPDRDESGIRARVIYPDVDALRGVIGAPCDAALTCDEGLACLAGSDDVPRCHAACDPAGAEPHCPDGGVCTSAGGVAGCIF